MTWEIKTDIVVYAMNFDFEALMNCPACGRKYAPGAVRVVTQKGSYLLLHAVCSSCFSASIAFVAKKGAQGSAISIGSLTDLSFEEASLMMRRAPLTINEVIDICSSINGEQQII